MPKTSNYKDVCTGHAMQKQKFPVQNCGKYMYRHQNKNLTECLAEGMQCYEYE